MEINSRRKYFSAFATMAAAVTGASTLFARQSPPGGAQPSNPAEGRHRGSNHIHNGIYYFSGTGANDGYPKDDHVTVTDPFEKHVTRTMDALKKSVERAGCTMDSLIHLEVFVCLPLADNVLRSQARLGSMRTRRSMKPSTRSTEPTSAPAKLLPAPVWLSIGYPAIR